MRRHFATSVATGGGSEGGGTPLSGVNATSQEHSATLLPPSTLFSEAIVTRTSYTDGGGSVKVLISTDLEGCSGVVSLAHIRASAAEYHQARRYLTHDVNAAVEGCIEAGATEIVVTDNHGLHENILFEELHPQAQLVVGDARSHRPQLVMQTLDTSFELALLLGYHAGAHSLGVLSHTYVTPSNFYEVRINSTPVGEIELAAALAGVFGVPCGLIVGDNLTVEEAQRVLGAIEAAVTKVAINRYAARLLPLRTTAEAIRTAARRACERATKQDFVPFQFQMLPFSRFSAPTTVSRTNLEAFRVPRSRHELSRTAVILTWNYMKFSWSSAIWLRLRANSNLRRAGGHGHAFLPLPGDYSRTICASRENSSGAPPV